VLNFGGNRDSIPCFEGIWTGIRDICPVILNGSSDFDQHGACEDQSRRQTVDFDMSLRAFLEGTPRFFSISTTFKVLLFSSNKVK